MKKLIPLLTIILLLTACGGKSTSSGGGVSGGDTPIVGDTNGSNTTGDKPVEYSPDAIDMKTATENYKSDFKQCKADGYPNLNFENAMAFPVEVIDKCRVLERKPSKEISQEIEGLYTEKEKVEKLKEYCEFFFGDYNEEYSGFDSYDGGFDTRDEIRVNGVRYTVFERISDHMEEIENEDFHINWFVYIEPYKRNYLWYTPSTMKYPFDLNKGGAATILKESGKGALPFMDGESEFAWEERVARYFNDGTNYDDVTYRLADGDYSIGEAIDYFTETFWEALPFDPEDKQPYLVRYVDVYQMTDDTYAYFIRFSPIIGAPIPLERVVIGTYIAPMDGASPEPNEFSISCQALMIKKNDIDMARDFQPLYGTHEAGEEITKIIPLKKAINIVSQKLTKNVNFNVVEVDLIYHGKNAPNSDTATVLRPTWLIRLYNPNDDNYYVTYVDAVTGDFSVYNYTTQYQP